jgi:hypothetical protein
MSLTAHCIQPVGGTNSWDGSAIQQVSCSPNNLSMFWYIASVPGWNGSPPGFHIVNWATGRCLDDTDGKTADWTPVQQWTCNSTSTTMMWRIGNQIVGNSYPLINVRSGKCLDVRYGSFQIGAVIQIYHCLPSVGGGTNPAQFWNFYWPL